MTNALFKEKSWYFRNALVRANYENPKLNVEKTQLPLEEFFKVLLYGYDIELHNRFLKIGQEYGTPTAKAIAKLHRQDDGINNGDDGINDGINQLKDSTRYTLTKTEENAVKIILKDNRITASLLAEVLSIKKRQAERIMASLKSKVGLRRVGSRKSGKWIFAVGNEQMEAGRKKQ